MINASAAVKHLKQADPVLARAIEVVGPLRLSRTPDRFTALVDRLFHH